MTSSTRISMFTGPRVWMIIKTAPVTAPTVSSPSATRKNPTDRARASISSSIPSVQVFSTSMVVRAVMAWRTTLQDAASISLCIRCSIEKARTVARPRMASSTRRARSAIADRSAAYRCGARARYLRAAT